MQWQTSIWLSVKGSKAEMWANVLARQPVASGRVHDDNNPNSMPEPKTGSIYMKNETKQKTQTRKVENDGTKLQARSLNFIPHTGKCVKDSE